MSRAIEFTGPLADGSAHCAITMAGGPLCGQPAAWHVASRQLHAEADGEVAHVGTLACGEHLAELDVTPPGILDRHPFGGVCLMPGSRWLLSTPAEVGRCIWMLQDGTLADEAEPAPVEGLQALPTMLAWPSPHTAWWGPGRGLT